MSSREILCTHSYFCVRGVDNLSRGKSKKNHVLTAPRIRTIIMSVFVLCEHRGNTEQHPELALDTFEREASQLMFTAHAKPRSKFAF